jgi:hypothetical protein
VSTEQRDSHDGEAVSGHVVASCWHCAGEEPVIVWRPSAKYKGAVAGYISQAKVAAIFPRARSLWQAKVLLVVFNAWPVSAFDSLPEAKTWCVEVVGTWFGQARRE